MSIEKMTALTILSAAPVKDAEGFAVPGETILASVRAYKEERHGSVAWRNRAAFSTATCLFRFRVIPDLTINTSLYTVCGTERHRIVSVEDVKGRGMYIEVLTERVMPSGTV